MPSESLPIAWPGCRPWCPESTGRLAKLAPWAASLVAGVLLALAAPPHDLWPLALAGLALLWLVVRTARPLQAFLLAWLAGSVAFAVACPWWFDLLQGFARLSPAASLGLMLAICAYQALVFGVWASGVRLLELRCRLHPCLSGPLLFAGLEAAQPFFFKMHLAILIWRAWPLTQVAELGGPPAVSALLVLIGLLLAELGLTLGTRQPLGRGLRLGALLLFLALAGGLMRAAWLYQLRQSAPALKVGLVQPNFGILSRQERQVNGDRYVKILQQSTATLAKAGAGLIIWPESAWPYPLDRGLRQDFPNGHPWTLRHGFGGRLLFGSLSRNPGLSQAYNSALLLDRSGAVAGLYDKIDLLPFGEYLPGDDFFPDSNARLRATMDHWPQITPGDSPPLLSDGDLRLGVAICSEELTPRQPEAVAAPPPNLLVSLVSNAWFGGSAAPHQHLALASFRAIESRRDLVRATNTGVSALIDSAGRLRAKGAVVAVTEAGNATAKTMLVEARLLEATVCPASLRRLFPYGAVLLLGGLTLLNLIRPAARGKEPGNPNNAPGH